MTRESFIRIVAVAIAFAMMTSAYDARAESCFVDLEEETADLDLQYALHVGRDDDGLVVCLGLMEGTDVEVDQPRVVARVAQEGPCVTEAGESYSRSDDGFSEIVISVAGNTPALLRAQAGLVCTDSAGMSPSVETDQTTLFGYKDVLSADEGMRVEVYNVDNDRSMALGLEEDDTEGEGGRGIDSYLECSMESDEYIGIYGVRVYNNIVYPSTFYLCDTVADEIICSGSAPSNADDYVIIETSNTASWVASPVSTTTCFGYFAVGGWYWDWDGYVELDGGSGADYLFGADGDDVIDGGGGNDHLYGGDGDDEISGGNGNDSLDGEDGNDVLFGGDGYDSLWGHDDDDHLYTGGDGSCRDEFASGGYGDDYVWGGCGDDTLWGGPGDDTLQGMGGDDAIYGHQGDDKLYGQDDDDYLNGGEGGESDGDECWGGGDEGDRCVDCEDPEEGCY